ncbi:MAG: hypothetical protein KDD66_00010 [Bdellovibrionales bacterium]|nr:hypothetical protein [Bdellovibrionales bacterium]
MKAVEVPRVPLLGAQKTPPSTDFKPPQDVRNQLIAGLGESLKRLAKKKKEAAASKTFITRKEYPRIATLKLGGRSDREIAKYYGLPPEKVSPHIRAALNALRNGEIRVDVKEVVDEAKKKAAEDTVGASSVDVDGEAASVGAAVVASATFTTIA